MDELRKRFKTMLSVKNCSISKLGGGNTTPLSQKMTRQINGDTIITADVLLNALLVFNDISAEWLMRGEGSMYKDGSGTPTHNVHVDTMSGGTAIAGNVSSAPDTSRDAMITQLLEQNNKLIQYLTSK